MVSKNIVCGILSVIGGILIHFSFGYFYTIGNLVPYVVSYLKLRVDSTITQGSAVWITAIALSVQGLSRPIGGAISPIIGYRAVVIISCIINNGGVLLSYFTIRKGFGYFVVTYAMILGLGFGFGSSVIFSVASSWFPAQKVFAVGFIVAGFGLGAIVIAPIQTAYINPKNIMINKDSGLFEDDALLDRIPTAFLFFGCALAVIQLIGILLLNEKPQPKNEVNSPETCDGNETDMKSLIHAVNAGGNADLNVASERGTENAMSKSAYRKQVCSLVQSHVDQRSRARTEPAHPIEINYSPLQTLRRHEFYLLWTIMLCCIIPITLITSSFKLVGQEYILNDRFLSGVAAASSVFLSGGRIMWGFICDRFSFKGPLCLMLLIWTVALFTFPFVVTIPNASIALFAIWVFLLFLCFSGVFILIPIATGYVFGFDNIDVNSGMVFTAFTIGGVVCGLISVNLDGRWKILYGICGSTCLLALFLAVWVVDPFGSKRLNICSNVLQRLQPRVPVNKLEQETSMTSI